MALAEFFLIVLSSRVSVHTDTTGCSMEAIYSDSDLMLVGSRNTTDSFFDLFLSSLFLSSLPSNSARFSLGKIQKIYGCIYLFTKENRCKNISVPVFLFIIQKRDLVKLAACIHLQAETKGALLSD